MTLAEARGLLEWTPSKLADESGVKLSAIYDIESGRTQNPGYITVSKVVAAFRRGGLSGLTPEDVFGLPLDEPSESRAS